MKEMEKGRSLEDGYHKWVCIDHSHPHIFKDGKCLGCGKIEKEPNYSGENILAPMYDAMVDFINLVRVMVEFNKKWGIYYERE